MIQEDFELKKKILKAISDGNLKLVQSFHQSIREIQSRSLGNSFLRSAAADGQVEIFSYIADEFYCGESDYMESACMAAQYNRIEILKILGHRAFCFASLMSAVFNGHLESVKFIVGEKKSDHSTGTGITKDNLGEAIRRSSEHGNIKIVEFLLRKFEELFDSKPELPILKAARVGDLEMIKFLFNFDKEEFTRILVYSSFPPTDEAAKFGHVDVVRFLIERGGKHDSDAVRIFISYLTGLVESKERVLETLTVYSVHKE